MQNLAGIERCDSEIVRELLAAQIDIIPHDVGNNEVPASFHGELNSWQFYRAWYYWVATPVSDTGGLLLDVADKLYTAHGQEVRAGGDCACRPPVTWASHFTVNERRICVDPNGEEEKAFRHMTKVGLVDGYDCTFVKSLEEVEHISLVRCYHIDSQEGLSAFADTIRDN